MAEGARITIYAQLQFRHDVESNWLAADPILKVGEPAYTIGYSDRFKLGDGQSKWSELPYLQLGKGGGSQAYESLAWSAIKTLTSGSASVLAQAYAVKQAYTELKSLIPNLADYYTKEQINALIPSLEGYATESFVNTKIADLINGAPTTLDTLKEIADAFAASQDVIEALDEAIGKKANQSDLTALAARVAANEGNITSLSSNKLDKSIWDSVFEIDAKGNLRAKVGIYSTSFISARTSDPSAGGGGEGGGGAFSLYTWDQVKAMTAEVGGVAPTAYALKQAYNELINATPTLSWNNIQDKPIFATVATSGSYSDLIGRPTALSDLANDVGYITASAIPSTYAWSAITGKPSFATVATSGSYNDLSNKPSIPSIAGLASESWVTSNFLGLGGGTITSGSNDVPLTLESSGTTTWLRFNTEDSKARYIGVGNDNTLKFQYDATTYTIIHSGNIGSYAFVPKSDTLLSNVNADNYLSNGVYLNQTGNGSGNSNFPQPYSIFATFTQSEIYLAQLSIGYNSFYFRRKLNTWDEWREVIHSGNISSYAPIYNSAGNVGIGTTSPTYKLDVNGPIAGHEIYSFAGWMTLLGTENVSYSTYLDNKNQYGLKIHYSNGIAGAFFSQDGNTEFYGNIAIYAAYGEEKGFSVSNSKGWMSMAVNGGGNSYISTSSQLAIYTNNSPKMLITSAGTVLLGATTDYGQRLQINGITRHWRYEGGEHLDIEVTDNRTTFRGYDTGEHMMFEFYSNDNLICQLGQYGANFYNNITANGTIYSAVGMYSPGYITARSTAGSSDRNLKTNITPVRNALAYILGTNYVSFDWKDTGEHSVGIIAQEELNREWSCLVQKYSEHYSYQYTQHTALIGSALQEEDKKVEALKAEVIALKAEVQRLRNERQLWQQ